MTEKNLLKPSNTFSSHCLLKYYILSSNSRLAFEATVYRLKEKTGMRHTELTGKG